MWRTVAALALVIVGAGAIAFVDVVARRVEKRRDSKAAYDMALDDVEEAWYAQDSSYPAETRMMLAILKARAKGWR